MTKFLLTAILLLAAIKPAASINELESLALRNTTYFENADFSPETLKNYLYFLGCSNVEIVYKQAKLESAHFKSGIFKRHKNIFGMKYATKRETTANGFIYADLGKVATYSKWQYSAKDYVIWQTVQTSKYSTKNYYAFLIECNYATDIKYISTLKRIK